MGKPHESDEAYNATKCLKNNGFERFLNVWGQHSGGSRGEFKKTDCRALVLARKSH
jgi:hypothetical protein